MSDRERHLRRATLFILVAAVLGSVAPVFRQTIVDAAPTGERVIFSGWNVGATPRICDVDSTLSATSCHSIPITDASPDGTSGMGSADFNGDSLPDLAVNNENGGVNVCLDDGVSGWTLLELRRHRCATAV